MRLAAAAAKRVPRLRTRAEGFAVIVASLSTSAFGGLATGEASSSALLRSILPVVLEGSLSHNYASCINHTLHPVGVRRFPKGDRKALWSPPQRRNPAPQATRRGAPVARRDSCKRKATRRYTRMGVERAEDPSQESRGQRPLVGFQRAKPFGGLSGQRPDRGPGAAPLARP